MTRKPPDMPRLDTLLESGQSKGASFLEKEQIEKPLIQAITLG